MRLEFTLPYFTIVLDNRRPVFPRKRLIIVQVYYPRPGPVVPIAEEIVRFQAFDNRIVIRPAETDMAPEIGGEGASGGFESFGRDGVALV